MAADKTMCDFMYEEVRHKARIKKEIPIEEESLPELEKVEEAPVYLRA